MSRFWKERVWRNTAYRIYRCITEYLKFNISECELTDANDVPQAEASFVESDGSEEIPYLNLVY